MNKKNKKGETPLHAACSKQDYDTVKKLLDQGAETNTQDYNRWAPLHELASRAEANQTLKLLLERGANPNVPGGEDNQTPLHEASAAGCIENCIYLIQKGASKTARDAHGQTPLDVALDENTRKALESTQSELTDSDEMDATVLMNSSAVPDSYILYVHTHLSGEQMKLIKSNASSKGSSNNNNLSYR